MPFKTSDFNELELRGKLTDRDAVCRSCGKVFRDYDLLDSRYRSTGGKGQGMVKRHLICAIFHNVTTTAEAEKKLDGFACLVPKLVNKQVKKLAEERRKMFSLQVRSVAFAGAMLIFGLIYNLNL
jgi:hypothetical protein